VTKRNPHCTTVRVSRHDTTRHIHPESGTHTAAVRNVFFGTPTTTKKPNTSRTVTVPFFFLSVSIIFSCSAWRLVLDFSIVENGKGSYTVQIEVSEGDSIVVGLFIVPGGNMVWVFPPGTSWRMKSVRSPLSLIPFRIYHTLPFQQSYITRTQQFLDSSRSRDGWRETHTPSKVRSTPRHASGTTTNKIRWDTLSHPRYDHREETSTRPVQCVLYHIYIDPTLK